jgi:hypothetical protein
VVLVGGAIAWAVGSTLVWLVDHGHGQLADLFVAALITAPFVLLPTILVGIIAVAWPGELRRRRSLVVLLGSALSWIALTALLAMALASSDDDYADAPGAALFFGGVLAAPPVLFTTIVVGLIAVTWADVMGPGTTARPDRAMLRP